MPRLIVLNGTPGCGKSTLARMFADDHPLALNLDIDQVRGFLASHPDFSVEKPMEVAQALGERAYLFTHAALISDEGLLMTPRRTDTDGFFISLLRRSA